MAQMAGRAKASDFWRRSRVRRLWQHLAESSSLGALDFPDDQLGDVFALRRPGEASAHWWNAVVDPEMSRDYSTSAACFRLWQEPWTLLRERRCRGKNAFYVAPEQTGSALIHNLDHEQPSWLRPTPPPSTLLFPIPIFIVTIAITTTTNILISYNRSQLHTTTIRSNHRKWQCRCHIIARPPTIDCLAPSCHFAASATIINFITPVLAHHHDTIGHLEPFAVDLCRDHLPVTGSNTCRLRA